MHARSEPRTVISLPSETELAMAREFGATPEMVFDAWTIPELIRRWFGPPGWTLSACEVDLRVGGEWRFVGGCPGKPPMALRGVYREVSRPFRLVYTQFLDGCEGQGAAEALCSVRLERRGSRTLMTSLIRYPSRDVRDSVLRHGTSEEGMDLVFDRLASILIPIAPEAR